MTVDPPALSIAEIVGIITICVTLLGGLVWLIRAVNSMSKQVVSNGGSSLRDAVDRIEDSQKDVRRDIREIRSTLGEHNERLYNGLGKIHGRLDEHIHDHLEGRA